LFLVSSSWAATRLTPADVEKWQADLRYFGTEAPKTHKDLYHSIARGEFEQRLQRLVADVPGMTREQVIAGLARLVAAIGDGHTYLILWSPEVGFRTVPARFYLFKDGLYVISARKDLARIVGGKLTRIGDRSAQEVIAAVSELVSRDNDSGLREFVPMFLGTPEVLEALGIVSSSERIPVVVTKDGSEVRAELPAEAGAATRRMSWVPEAGWVDARKSTPLWLTHPDVNFWNQFIPETKTMYVQYNAVYPINGLTPGAFFGRVTREAEQQQAERFIVDVRLNGGGNNGFNLPIIHSFIRSERFDRRGQLFTLIGRRTFSAAQNFVNQMGIHTETLFVGEPTGGRPNHFGDNAPVVLPNSRIEIRLSTLWWQDRDPRDQRAWQAPDLSVPYSFDDYRKGRDPVLETALNYGLKPTLEETVRKAVLNGGLAAARDAVKAFRADPLNEYVTPESLLNRLGYELLNEHKTEAAVMVFRINTEEFPDSANVWDSLGEAYMIQGNAQDAIRNYERSLELNSRNGNARAMIQRLKASSAKKQ
jgi:hypothetical protein